ncbi:MAG: alanine racemase [Cyclobacteriaceae bacterium]|nr:alanine racemase [Cyclobacteriaceae bacterium]
MASFCDLHLCVESEQATRLLTSGLTASVKLFIEIDTGYHRTGIGPDDSDSINAILQVIEHNHHLSFAGFLSHDGHTYHSNSVNEIKRIHDNTLARMQGLGALYRDHFPDLQLSIGDTPSCSLFEDFSGMTEIRPGNLVFYDLTQHAIGCCTQDQIAIAMACPVVALYPEREEIIVHGGGVHFSKDFLARADGLKIYGEVVKLTEGGWQLPPLSIYIKSLSQEHGILHASASDIAKLHVGDMLGVLPVHACLTADAMGEYRIIGGKTVSMM